MELGEKIAMLRKQRKMSQAALASKSGLSQSGISFIEKSLRSPSFGTLGLIAEALGVSVTELMDGVMIVQTEELPELDRAIQLFKELTAEQQQNAIRYMEFLKNQ